MLRTSFALVVAAILWQAPRVAAACSCAGLDRSPEAIRRSAREAGAVFEGRVLSHVIVGGPYDREHPDEVRERRVTFAVRRSWTGAPDERVTVHVPLTGPECGLSLRAGTRYLVFAYRRRDGTLTTSRCTLTTRLLDADELLAALGDASPPSLDARGCAVGDRRDGLALLTLLALRRRRRAFPGTASSQCGPACRETTVAVARTAELDDRPRA